MAASVNQIFGLGTINWGADTVDRLVSNKQDHEKILPFSVTGNIVATNGYLFIARGACTVKAIEAAIEELIGTGTVTIDLHKGTSVGAFATILSATFGFTSGSALRAVSSGTISSATLVNGDQLKLVITVAGGGTAFQGLNVNVTLTAVAPS